MGVDELIANAEQLPLSEQLQLVTSLLDKIRQQHDGVAADAPTWSDICGAAPYPLADEDAQAWISRSRRGSDEHREQLLRA